MSYLANNIHPWNIHVYLRLIVTSGHLEQVVQGLLNVLGPGINSISSDNVVLIYAFFIFIFDPNLVRYRLRASMTWASVPNPETASILFLRSSGSDSEPVKKGSLQT